jgi:methyl-accepting chemotaxis protein
MQKKNRGLKGIKDLKITWKMLISSLVPVIILLVVWMLMVKCTDKTKIGSPLYDEIILSNNLIADILPPPEYIIEPYVTALEYITTSDEAKRADLVTYFNQLEEIYNQRYDYWNSTLKNQNDLRQVFLVEAYNAAQKFFDIFHNEIMPAVKSGDQTKIKAAQSDLEAVYKEHRSAIDKTVTLSSAWADTVTKGAVSSEKNTSNDIIIIIIAAVFSSLLISFIISRSMVRHIKYVYGINRKIADGELSAAVDDKQISSDEIGQLCLATSQISTRLNSYADYIKEITDVLESMAQGDMCISLKKDYEGEFSSIRNALIRISTELNKTMTTIKETANQVNSGASQIADGAQLLAQGSTEQSASLDELVNSITKISGDATKNSENVKIAMNLVEQSTNGVQESNAQMGRLITAMNEISTSANKISAIIDTIDDISFQTNILALNASIEAARAGAAGKGFSVVAEEVRNLASKSAEAAKKTSDLISNTITAIQQGKQTSEVTAGALSDVKEKTLTVETTIKAISSASNAQATEILDIKERLSQIANIVQQNSATAQESAAISEELSAQAQNLHYEVGRFNLNSDDEHAAAKYLEPVFHY